MNPHGTSIKIEIIAMYINIQETTLKVNINIMFPNIYHIIKCNKFAQRYLSKLTK